MQFSSGQAKAARVLVGLGWEWRVCQPFEWWSVFCVMPFLLIRVHPCTVSIVEALLVQRCFDSVLASVIWSSLSSSLALRQDSLDLTADKIVNACTTGNGWLYGVSYH